MILKCFLLGIYTSSLVSVSSSYPTLRSWVGINSPVPRPVSTFLRRGTGTVDSSFLRAFMIVFQNGIRWYKSLHWIDVKITSKLREIYFCFIKFPLTSIQRVGFRWRNEVSYLLQCFSILRSILGIFYTLKIPDGIALQSLHYELDLWQSSL